MILFLMYNSKSYVTFNTKRSKVTRQLGVLPVINNNIFTLH